MNSCWVSKRQWVLIILNQLKFRAFPLISVVDGSQPLSRKPALQASHLSLWVPMGEFYSAFEVGLLDLPGALFYFLLHEPRPSSLL